MLGEVVIVGVDDECRDVECEWSEMLWYTRWCTCMMHVSSARV